MRAIEVGLAVLTASALVGGSASGQTTPDGYVYLRCEGQETTPFGDLRPKTATFKIGSGDWFVLEDQAWQSLCTSWKGIESQCSLSGDIYWQNRSGQWESWSNRVNRVTGKWGSDYTGSGGTFSTVGACRSIPPPSLSGRQF